MINKQYDSSLLNQVWKIQIKLVCYLWIQYHIWTCWTYMSAIFQESFLRQFISFTYMFPIKLISAYKLKKNIYVPYKKLIGFIYADLSGGGKSKMLLVFYQRVRFKVQDSELLKFLKIYRKQK